MPAFQWLGAWLLFIVILAGLAKTRAGKTLVYYLLWLAVLFLLVSHYQEITDMFVSAGIVPSGNTSQQ